MSYKSVLLGAAVAILAGPAGASDLEPGSSGVLGELNFRFDSAALMANAPAALDKVVAFASANPEDKIVLAALNRSVRNCSRWAYPKIGSSLRSTARMARAAAAMRATAA
jgi:hypothetical protein